MTRLFLLFTVVPLVELSLLLRIGQRVGPTATLALVIGTGAVGAVLARQAGIRALDRVRMDMERGVVPTDSLLDGLLILVAGVMLITPGVLTDVAALTLMTPLGRRPVRAALKRRFARAMADRAGIVDVTARPRNGGPPPA